MYKIFGSNCMYYWLMVVWGKELEMVEQMTGLSVFLTSTTGFPMYGIWKKAMEDKEIVKIEEDKIKLKSILKSL